MKILKINEMNFENNNEPLSAKIRNKLGPYKNLTALIKKYNDSESPLKEKIWKIIMNEVEVVENNSEALFNLIDEINNK